MCTEKELDKTTETNVATLRPMLCELNALSRADGSTLLTQGCTAVMASIYGPVEVKLQNLSIEKAYVDVYYRPKSGMPNVNDRQREQIIRNICETALLVTLHPRTAITIQLQELEDKAGLIACAVNAACLSLLNSGLPMKFLVAAVQCIVNDDNELILDPDNRQSKGAKAFMTFVFDSVEKNTVAIHTTGKFSIGQYNDALVMCREASNVIFNFYKDSIRKFAKVL